MREALITFRCFAGRFKFISAILAIFLSGALLAVGTCAWHYNHILSGMKSAHKRQIVRLEADIDVERNVNRQILANLTLQISEAVDQLGRATEKAQAAAATAQSAAKSAAQANIRVTEIVPSDQLQLQANIK